MINKYRWSFPKLDGGGVEGMNDPGVETFKNDIYASLAKEILQNSVDARLDKERPVVVKIELFSIDSDQFPNLMNIVLYWRVVKNLGRKIEKRKISLKRL